MNLATCLLLGALAAVGTAYIRLGSCSSGAPAHCDAAAPPADLLTGFVTNFFDTLGIGCCAPTTAIFKIFKRVPDENIPGTLNSGHALPVLGEALIFIAAVTVAPLTLVNMIAAAALGGLVRCRHRRRAAAAHGAGEHGAGAAHSRRAARGQYPDARRRGGDRADRGGAFTSRSG